MEQTELDEKHSNLKRTGYVYDDMMELHRNSFNVNHPEGPSRTSTAFSMLLESGLLEKCVRIKSRYE